MKTIRITSTLVTALALLTIISAPSTVSAQIQMKPAQKLMKVQTIDDLQKVEAGDIIIMSCPKCKETYAQVVDKSLKGMKAGELKKVPIHLCGTCETSIVTQGTGHQAKDALVHTCKTCGSQDVSCCVMKKNGGVTKGMEEHK
jgi:hypothetical protein